MVDDDGSPRLEADNDVPLEEASAVPTTIVSESLAENADSSNRTPALPTLSSAPMPSPHQNTTDDGGATELTVTPIPRPGTKWSLKEYRAALSAAGMPITGKRETLYKRLNNAYIAQEEAKRVAAAAAAAAARGPPSRRPPRHAAYLCFDVEATCEEGPGWGYPNEIIEFPVVLLRWETDSEASKREGNRGESGNELHVESPPRPRLVIADTFHTYVRPTWRPQLSKFCTDLTGIRQSMVDKAPTFPAVLKLFEAWLRKHDLLNDDELAGALWVTDGPWDLREFVPKQLHITPLDPPRYPKYLLGDYLNLKEAVRTVLSQDARRTALSEAEIACMGPITTARRTRDAKQPLTISDQVRVLGLGTFEGRQHSGIDDATNIARIVAELGKRGVLLEPNARLRGQGRHYDWMGKPGEVIWDDARAAALAAAQQEPENLLSDEFKKMSMTSSATDAAAAGSPAAESHGWPWRLWQRGSECTTA